MYFSVCIIFIFPPVVCSPCTSFILFSVEFRTCSYSSFMIIKKLYVFGWLARLTSRYSDNLALGMLYILSFVNCILFGPNKYLLLPDRQGRCYASGRVLPCQTLSVAWPQQLRQAGPCCTLFVLTCYSVLRNSRLKKMTKKTTK